jgi:hypothetical protein
MAAVINLNFLNFFKLKEDNSTVSNVRFNTFSFEKEQRENPAKDRIIDITPFSRVIADASDNDAEDSNPALIDYRKAGHHKYSSTFSRPYDRNGKAVEDDYPKGLHLDLYV